LKGGQEMIRGDKGNDGLLCRLKRVQKVRRGVDFQLCNSLLHNYKQDMTEQLWSYRKEYVGS
jgi:hypothetical protein